MGSMVRPWPQDTTLCPHKLMHMKITFSSHNNNSSSSLSTHRQSNTGSSSRRLKLPDTLAVCELQPGPLCPVPDSVWTQNIPLCYNKCLCVTNYSRSNAVITAHQSLSPSVPAELNKCKRKKKQ